MRQLVELGHCRARWRGRGQRWGGQGGCQVSSGRPARRSLGRGDLQLVTPGGCGSQGEASQGRNAASEPAHIPFNFVGETRECAQCGASFAPRREHARFCSANCRVAWNRQHVSTNAAGDGTLDWALTAMREATNRLLSASGLHRPQAFAVITEAVWWVTMVDATVVRYHPDEYNVALAAHDDAERQVIEDTFAGLRFVRNRMGYEADHDDFIQPRLTRSGSVAGRIAAWTWKPVPAPALDALPARARDWEMTRCLAYQSQLAGHRIGETFSRAAEFLQQASGRILSSQ
jgi:hypothetical protein